MRAELIAVVGPTGSGKSKLAISLALALAERGIRAEIVNADAMQLYRGMNIGTAKLAESERGGVPHHLIDRYEFGREVTVADYQREARAVIDSLIEAGKLPILVGGSMLYVTAVLGHFEFHSFDAELRQHLEEELESSGPGQLHDRLVALDPAAAERISPLNGRRIVRALEIATLEGEGFEAQLPERWESWRPVLMIGLGGDREALKASLTERVEQMWQSGLVDEVRALDAAGFRAAKTAAVAIGYRQALAQLDGELTEQQAKEETTRLTLRYLRRQLSWFRRDPRINWLDYADPALLEKSLELTAGALSIEEQPLGAPSRESKAPRV